MGTYLVSTHKSITREWHFHPSNSFWTPGKGTKVRVAPRDFRSFVLDVERHTATEISRSRPGHLPSPQTALQASILTCQLHKKVLGCRVQFHAANSWAISNLVCWALQIFIWSLKVSTIYSQTARWHSPPYNIKLPRCCALPSPRVLQMPNGIQWTSGCEAKSPGVEWLYAGAPCRCAGQVCSENCGFLRVSCLPRPSSICTCSFQVIRIPNYKRYSHSLSITCICCFDEIKGTQDLKIYSHTDSQILSRSWDFGWCL